MDNPNKGPLLKTTVALVGIAVLTVFAVLEQVWAGLDPWLIAVDIAVGLALVASAGMARGPKVERLLIASVGVLWLVGSVLPAARLTHQAALVAALVAFPSGRPKGTASWLLIALGIPIAFGVVPQAGAAAVFAAVGAATPWGSITGRFPRVAAVGVAFVLFGSWWLSRNFSSEVDPVTALIVYEIALLLIATGFPLAAASVVASREKLADRLLGGEVQAGLAGLEGVMQEVLRDPSVRILAGSGSGGNEGSPGLLEVIDNETMVARVGYSTRALDDPAVAAAVSAAVSMAARRERLEADQLEQLFQLEEARARLLAAADRQREIMARQLLDDVVAPLRSAISMIESRRRDGEPHEGTEAIDIVVQELTAADEEVLGLVAGIPPAPLGDGRVIGAIESLARRSPVPVTVSSTSVQSDVETEMTLFYVCSEALANSVKHSGARNIEVGLSLENDRIALRVSDDGRGGADPSGAGLQGLADRVAARGGRLQVVSPPGAGTIVTATIPRSRSAATALPVSPPPRPRRDR